jgi:hypothetical protein
VFVIVIDALDECNNPEHAKLINLLLSELKSLGLVRLKSFITSRPELPIRLGFNNISRAYENIVLHWIPQLVIKEDITAYFQNELARIRQEYNESLHPTSSRQLPPNRPGTGNICGQVDTAIPLSIFASIICRFIQERRLGGPNELLARDIKTDLYIKNLIWMLHTSRYQTYY